MLKRTAALILIIVLNISIVPAFSSVQEKILMSDNFDSYEDVISRKMWYGQTNKPPAGVNSLYVFDTDRGKSVEIVTSGYRQEAIRLFTKSSADMQCIRFSFSIYFCSDNTASSLWTYSADQNAEKNLFSFNKDGGVSINGITFTKDEFTRKSNIWYDVNFYYNVNDGAVKLEICDENGTKTTLFGSHPTGISGFNRFNLVTSGGSEGNVAITYLDDVSVLQCEPFERREKFSVLCENFDKYTENATEIDNISIDQSGEKMAYISQSDRGKSLKLKYNNEAVSISHNADYLMRGGDAVTFDMSVKALGGANVDVMLDSTNLLKLDFSEKNICFADKNYRTNLCVDLWYDIKMCFDTIENTAEIYVSSERENVSYKEEFILNRENIKNLYIKVYGENSGEVMVDNLHLYTEDKMVTPPDTEIFESANNTGETLLFSDDFSEGVPSGWVKDGEISEKSFEAENVKVKARVSFSEGDAAKYITIGGVRFIEFSGNKAIVLGKEINENIFSFDKEKEYTLTIIYIPESGYVRVHIENAGERKTFEGALNENSADTVGFSEGIKPLEISVFETPEVTNIKNIGEYKGADKFENYLVSVPPVYKKSGTGYVNPADTIHGISMEFSADNGKEVTLCKKTEINAQTEKLFNVSFSFCKVTNSGIYSLYIKDENEKNTNIFTVSESGAVMLGKEETDFTLLQNVWYDVKLFVYANGTISAEISDATNEITLSANVDQFGKNIKNIYISLKGTSGDKSRVYFDNFKYTFSGMCDFFTDKEKAVLTFCDDIECGTFLVNGQEKNIEKTEFSDNKAYIYFKDMEGGKNYNLSFNSALGKGGKSYSGNCNFTTGNLSVNIKNIGFKNMSGKDSVQKGKVFAYATLSSVAEQTVTLFMAAYSKKSGKLLGIVSEKKSVDNKETDFEKYLTLPEDFENIDIKFFLWAGGSVIPLTSKKNTLSPFNVPKGEKIIETVKNRAENIHPRIMVTRDKINEIRKAITENKGMAGDWFALLDSADEILRKEQIIPSLSNGRLDYSRSLLSTTKTLGMAYQISGDEKYAERLYKEMESAALNLSDWNAQGSFLDTAAMIEAFSLGYDFIYDHIKDSEERKLLIFTTLKKHGLDEAKALYNMVNPKGGYLWTNSAQPDNWNIICNSTVLLAALTFCDEYPVECEEIFDKGFKSLTMAASKFAPDGGWFESVSYWHYQMGYYVDFLMGIDNTLGTDYGFLSVEGFDNTLYFLLGLTGGSGRVFNFSNCINENIYSGAVYYLADKFDEKNAFVFQKKFLTKYGKTLPVYALLYNDYSVGEEYDNMELDYYFRDVEVCSMRSGWEDSDTFVAFKGGRSNFSHGHLDTGEFVIDMLGERFAMGLGQEDYSVPFENIEELYRRRAEGHNTIVINPSSSADQVKSARTEICRFEGNTDEAVAVCDMTPSYADNAKKALRGVKLFDNRSAVLIRDEIETFKESEIYWFMHTDAEIELSEDGKVAYLTKNRKKIKAEILTGGQIFKIMDAKPLDTSPQNELQSKNEGVKKLTIHLENITNAEITVLISPENYVFEGEVDTDIVNW